MNNQQPKKKKFNWWWLVIGLIVIFLLINLTMPTTNVKSISLTQLRDDTAVKYDEAIGDYVVDTTAENKIYGAYKVENTYYLVYKTTMEGRNAQHVLTAKEIKSIENTPANI